MFEQPYGVGPVDAEGMPEMAFLIDCVSHGQSPGRSSGAPPES
jgi:hypothetical protein